MSDGDINLAALWVPVMAETSKIKGQLRKAGEEGREEFLAGARFSELGGQLGKGLLEGFQRFGPVEKLSGMFGGLNLASLGVAAGITGIVVAAGKLVDGLKDVGEEFENINRSITLMTADGSSGLADLQLHADNLVATLDTSTKNLGTDMATLATRLNMQAGPALDKLTRHVEELSDRFGRIDINSLAGGMQRFGLAGEGADDALASFMETAMRLGVSLPDMVKTFSTSGAVLHDLGLNADQAGVLIGKLQQLGPAGAGGIEVLQKAMKEAGKQGMDLKDFLKQESEFFASDASNAAKDAEASTVFGSKKWEEARDALKKYQETVDEVPPKIKASGDQIDQMIDKTETLGNKWQHLMNAMASDFKPVGDAIIDALDQMISGFDIVFDAEARSRSRESHGFGPPTPKYSPPNLGLPAVPGAPPSLLGPHTTTPAPGLLPGGHAPVPGSTTLLPGAPTLPGTSIPIPGITAAPSSFGGVRLSDYSTPMGGGGGVPLVQNPDGTWTSTDPAWAALIARESGGNPTNVNNSDSNAISGHPSGGLFQIVDGTWAGAGGLKYSQHAKDATPQQQAEIAANIFRAQGGGPWGEPRGGVETESALSAGLGGSGAGAPGASSGAAVDWWRGSGSGGGGQSGLLPNAGGGLNLSTIPVAAQQYANDCIDASARIILSHAGVNMSEDQLKSVIAPGGTIGSQAAGLNRLNPAGGYVAMAGSGGSQQAMFAAIKASIDSGTGSILNVAPGSSIAGRNFSEGHFIAATGYNADGTINLSDTASGTKYTVSAADAFQATQGRGIVAGTGRGPAPQSGGPGGPGGSMLDFWSGGKGRGGGGRGHSPFGPGGSPYLPGTGETQRQARDAQEHVDDARTALGEANDSVADLTQEQKELKAKIGTDTGKLAGLGPAERANLQAEIDKENKKLVAVTKDLNKALTAQTRAGERVTDMEQDQADLGHKRAPGGSRGGEDHGSDLISQWVSGLAGGFGQMLGMGDIFKKPIGEWGIVKLLKGLFQWGFGEANMWGDIMNPGGGIGGVGAGSSPFGGSGAAPGPGGGMPGMPGGSPTGGGPSIAGLKIPSAVNMAWQASHPGGQGSVAGTPTPATRTAGYVSGVGANGGNVHNTTIINGTYQNPGEIASAIKPIQNAQTGNRAAFGGTPVVTGPGGG